MIARLWDKAQADPEELEAGKRKQAELEAYRQRTWYKKISRS